MIDAFQFLGNAVNGVLDLFDDLIDGLGAWPYILVGIVFTMLIGSVLVPMLTKSTGNKAGRKSDE